MIEEDPSYTDSCLETSGKMCEFCCMTDVALCSQDPTICAPITDRNLDQLWDAIYILGAIVVGFPLTVFVFRQLMIVRYLAKCYPLTGGITIIEMMARTIYCMCCCKNFAQTYVLVPEEKQQKRGSCIGGGSEMASSDNV